MKTTNKGVALPVKSIGISRTAKKAVQSPVRTLVTALITAAGLAVGAAVAWADPIGASAGVATTAPALETMEVKPDMMTTTVTQARLEAAAAQALSASEIRLRQIALARTSTGARVVARALIAKSYKWNATQFTCLNRLWTRESNWRYRANNKSSGAYGIPQALPGSKMSNVADDWRTNPVTQIKWGLRYIDLRYGTPCNAWSQLQRNGWY